MSIVPPNPVPSVLRSKQPGQVRAQNKKANARVIARRLQVAKLRLAGITNQADIAKALGVSQPTISNDMKAVDNDFRIIAAQDTRIAKGRDLARLEDLIKRYYKPALDGDIDAANMVLKFMKRQAEILGYDAAHRSEISGPGGKPIQLETYDFSDLTQQQKLDLYESIEAFVTTTKES